MKGCNQSINSSTGMFLGINPLLEDEGNHVKMHDVIRDMSLWLEKDNLLVLARMRLVELPRVEKWEGVKRLSLMCNGIKELTEVPPCQKLVTLFLNDNERLYELNGGFFHFMGALTVLDLSYTKFRRLPKSIEKLISLQYLNIKGSAIQELPIELAALAKLMFLDISCLHLTARRSERVISSMSSLQVLKMGYCYYRYREEGEWTGKNDEEMLLDELECLENLKELEITLSSVHNLQGLNIKIPKLVTSITAIYLNDLIGSRLLNISLLEDMKYLSTLAIYCCDLEEIHHDAVDRISISSLHLKTVTRFNYLLTVNVSACKYLKDLTIMLILLPNLRNLYVLGCDSMEEIISSKILSSLVEEAVDFRYLKFFSKLNLLCLGELPELRYIYQNPLPFPLLRKFRVKDCPLLKKLPLDSHSGDGPKIGLDTEEEWWEAIEWKDDATKAVLLPRFKCKFFD